MSKVKTIHVYDLITPESISGIHQQIERHHAEKPGEQITLFVYQTRIERTLSRQSMTEALRLYYESSNFPNLQTIAGPGMCATGTLIFLAGRKRILMPNASFTFVWNAITSVILASESKKDPEHILRVFNGNNMLNCFQFRTLGIEYHGNYVGFLPQLKSVG